MPSHQTSFPCFMLIFLLPGGLLMALPPVGLIVWSPWDNLQLQASSFSCKSCYQLLLSINLCKPHCVEKFRLSFGNLDWSSTWKSLCFTPFDRQAIDISWKVVHSMLYTAERLASFGYNVLKACFHLESLEHLFFFLSSGSERH